MAPTQTLGHDSEDRVVAADAGPIFFIVLLGVADLKELWLQEEQPGEEEGNIEQRGGAVLIHRSPANH